MTKGLFVGLSTIDLSYRVNEFPGANSKIVANSQDLFVGGPATNAAAAFSHLGGEATLVTVVGRHVLSGAISEELERYSIQLIDLNPEFAETPVISSIAINGAGERSIVSANATRMAALSAKVDEAALEGCSVVLVDGHYMQACQAWSAAARARGITVVLDGGSWKDGTDELLRSVDCAVCSADFRPEGCSTSEEVFAVLRGRGVSRIAITNGAGPIHFVSGEGAGTVPVSQVDALDTSGAGDIFHGAFCYYFSSGRGFADALAEAARVASESCRFHGTREWMSAAGRRPG